MAKIATQDPPKDTPSENPDQTPDTTPPSQNQDTPTTPNTQTGCKGAVYPSSAIVALVGAALVIKKKFRKK